MSTHVIGFQSFFRYFASYCITTINNHSIRVNPFTAADKFGQKKMMQKTLKYPSLLKADLMI